MKAWGYDAGQRFTVYRKHLPFADLLLQKQPQEIDLDWPRSGTVEDGEVVYFHFEDVAPVQRADRQLAAGFDRIEIVEAGAPLRP